MNFTREIRRDLLREFPEKRCCRLSLLAAILDTSGERIFGRDGSLLGFSFTSEDEDVAEYFLAVAEQLFGIRMTLTGAVLDPKHGKNKITFSFRGRNAEEKLKEIDAHGLSGNFDECCAVSYLKGAFLGSGSCTLPGGKTGYHLEFVFRENVAVERFCELLDGMQLIAGTVPRGDKRVVYLKSREGISDFLFVVGAGAALRTLENVSSAREESNQENRMLNCIASNADRSATASAEQVIAFTRLKEEGILPSLALPLRAVAEGRMAMPTHSLAELAAALHISKSCLNHRMRKLMQIYAEHLK